MNSLEYIKAKIISCDSLPQLITRLRLQDKKIVFTNGCFDILHKGHVEYLAIASGLGDVLIVGLNTDSSVKRLKGNNRPLQGQESRALVLASLHVVHYVILFEEDTPYELIKIIKPDVLVKGGDYKAEEVVGYDIVKQNGGEVVIVELTQGYSTSNIVSKLKP